MRIVAKSRSRSPESTKANRQVAVEGSFELDASADYARHIAARWNVSDEPSGSRAS